MPKGMPPLSACPAGRPEGWHRAKFCRNMKKRRRFSRFLVRSFENHRAGRKSLDKGAGGAYIKVIPFERAGASLLPAAGEMPGDYAGKTNGKMFQMARMEPFSAEVISDISISKAGEDPAATLLFQEEIQ